MRRNTTLWSINFENRLIFGEDNGRWQSGAFFWDIVYTPSPALANVEHLSVSPSDSAHGIVANDNREDLINLIDYHYTDL